MKYMGSKRAMLLNGLGDLLTGELAAHLRRHGARSARFVDVFTGTGSVAAFAAQRQRIRTHAADLQLFATVLAGAIIARDAPVDSIRLWAKWSVRALTWLEANSGYRGAIRHSRMHDASAEKTALAAKRWAAVRDEDLLRAYVGHYFSPLQGLHIVALRSTLPPTEPDRTICLAALISASSACSASPGHTAEPFRPSGAAGKHVLAAWRRDVFELTFMNLSRLAPRHAIRAGTTEVGDATTVLRQVDEKDLVFIDPPYSAVQYSRFYHVLESVARGKCGSVEGRGRYPAMIERPQSLFSNTTTASAAMKSLLKLIADCGARAVVTFPSGTASNGLSGEKLREIAHEFFYVRNSRIDGSFSTMGGKPVGRGAKGAPPKPGHRPARQSSHELVLVLRPR